MAEPIKKTANGTLKPCFWCEYGNGKIIKRNDSPSMMHTSNSLLTGDTKEAVDAQIATLKLAE